jgi:hypothetical protein
VVNKEYILNLLSNLGVQNPTILAKLSDCFYGIVNLSYNSLVLQKFVAEKCKNRSLVGRIEGKERTFM